ncbi:hypothetical protein VCR20J5_630020 [Vibrio crassostreae]|nr:hypothetical protein VCR20J5_630020 [Vibrio crassostreae]
MVENTSILTWWHRVGNSFVFDYRRPTNRKAKQRERVSLDRDECS